MVTVQKWFSVSKFKSGMQLVTHQPGQLKEKFKQENYNFECFFPLRMQQQAWLTGETEQLKDDFELVNKNQSPSPL